MRVSYLPLRRLPLAIALQAVLCSSAWAVPGGFTVDAGTTNTNGQNISSATGVNNTGTVNGDLSVSASGVAAVTVTTSADGTVTINNTGTIEQTATTGNSRGIYSKTNTNTLIINNAAGATISAIGDDAVKIGKAGAKFTIDNQGTIWQKGTGVDAGQALDLADGAFAGNSLTNGSATNTAAMIRADGADAINPASNMLITNYGTIISNGMVNTKCRDIVANACKTANATSPADGIDVDKNTGVVINNFGVISGSRHGITADVEVTVTNNAGGQIIGRNGSGVGTDGTGIVDNYGLISGRYAGAGNGYDHTLGGALTGISPSINDGDGDGIDIDGKATITNHGRIEGLGGGGFDADGHPNGGDGIAAGGGEITNYQGGSIWGQSSGILIDDGANGTASGNITPGRGTKDTPGVIATIKNGGEIASEKGVAIGLVGNFDDKITNDATGVITGSATAVRIDQLSSTTPGAAIQMGAGNDLLENHGRIEGKNGLAIDMGDNDDTLHLFDGSTIIGAIDGGAGVNLLQTSGTQTFNTAGQLINFQNFNVTDGSTTFNYALGNVGNIQIDAGASLRVNGAFGTTGNLTVNGTLQAPTGNVFQTTSVAGNYNQGASGVLETRIGLNGGDKLTVAQTATLANGATIRPILTGYVGDGATYTIIGAGSLAAATANLQVTGSNFLTYTLQQNGNDLVLVAHRAAGFDSFAAPGNTALATALQSLMSTGSQGSLNLLNAIESLPNAAAVSDAASQLAPETNAAAQSTANAAQGSVFAAFDNRVDAVRNGGSGGSVSSLGNTGLSGGDAAGNRFWVQGLASVATQKARSGANGYDLDAQGIAFGFETDLNQRDMLGFSAGYTQASTDGRDLGSGDGSDVKSYHAGAYFSRTDAAYTLDGSLVVSANRYSTQRTVLIPGFSEKLTGDYSGTQVGARVEFGLPFAINNRWDGRWLLGARLSRMDNDGYAESAGLTSQQVDSVGANSAQSVLGVELVDHFAKSSSASLRARYLHEFANTPGVSATFANGGPSFTVDGVQPGRDALELGIGYRQMTTGGTLISIGYDLELRDRYVGHQLTAKAVWSF